MGSNPPPPPPPTHRNSVLLLFNLAVISNITQTNLIRAKYNLAKPYFRHKFFFTQKNLVRKFVWVKKKLGRKFYRVKKIWVGKLNNNNTEFHCWWWWVRTHNLVKPTLLVKVELGFDNLK